VGQPGVRTDSIRLSQGVLANHMAQVSLAALTLVIEWLTSRVSTAEHLTLPCGGLVGVLRLQDEMGIL